MEVKAKANFIKISPRKLRLVVDLIRGLKVGEAVDQLQFSKKNAALPLIKLLKSAIANATNNFDIKEDNLFIKEIRADDGPTLHRWMPKARGRATPIRKRTTHVSLILEEIVKSGTKKAKQQKIEAPVKLDARPKEDEGIKIKGDKKKEETPDSVDEKGKKISDPRGEGKGKHTKIEGSSEKGFVNKIFRRKSG
jgi:large subunit ribosomal protein L22